MKAQTRKLQLSDSVDLKSIAGSLPERLTGADIGAITSQAFSHALESKLRWLEDEALSFYESSSEVISDKNVAIASYLNALEEHELIVKVERTDFDAVIETFVPSVSADDYAYYENLRSMFEG